MRSNVNVITGLKDWSRDSDRIIPKEVSAAKTMNGVIASEMGLYTDDKGYFHTSGTVGVGWLKDHHGKIITDSRTGKRQALVIRPRFNLNPWNMLVKVMNDPEYELYTSGNNSSFFEIYTGDELIPVKGSESGGELLAAISFLKECEKICKKHLRQEMTFEERNFNGKVVGNIQVVKHIKHNVSQAREDRVFCRYPVFTVDTLENRIMKAALKKAHCIFRENKIVIRELGRIFSYCENSLKSVRTVNIVKNDFNKVNLTGFNSYYKTVIELARTVLLQNGANNLYGESSDDTKYIIPYTINMESLFEFYVRASIKEYLRMNPTAKIRLDEYRSPERNPLLTLKEKDSRAYLMNHYVPDVALLDTSGDKEKYIAVFDVKYQNSTNDVYAETRRHNSHQLLFYTLLLNVKKCGFIFPKQGTNQAFNKMELYMLNIQSGDAMDESTREYTQWTTENSDNGTERIIKYVQGIQARELSKGDE